MAYHLPILTVEFHFHGVLALHQLVLNGDGPEPLGFDRDLILPEKAAEIVAAVGVRASRGTRPPLSFNKTHQPVVSRLRRHVGAEEAGGGALPGIPVGEVPPGDRLNGRVREEHRVEAFDLVGLPLLAFRGRRPRFARPLAALLGLAGQNRGFGEMQRHAETGKPLADLPDLAVIPRAAVHMALDADDIVDPFTLFVDQLLDELLVRLIRAIVVDQQRGVGIRGSSLGKACLGELDAACFLPHLRHLRRPLQKLFPLEVRSLVHDIPAIDQVAKTRDAIGDAIILQLPCGGRIVR